MSGSVPKQGHTTVVYDDQLFVFGGRSESGKLLNDTWKVRPDGTAEKLLVGGKVPEERDFHTAHIYGDMMYVVHGHVVQHTPSFRYSLPVLDLETNTWDKLVTTGDVPQALCHHASAIVGPTIYVSGGYEYQANDDGSSSSSSSSSDSDVSHKHESSQFYELNTESLVWTEIQVGSIGPRLWGHTAVTWNSMMLIFGGVNKASGKESNTLWTWNFLTRKWSAVTPLTVTATRDYTANGPGELSFKSGQFIQVLEPSHGKEWGKGSIGKNAGTFPTAYTEHLSPSHRSLHISVSCDKHVIVWGGEIGGKDNNVGDSWALDPSNMTWTKMPTEGSPAPQGGLSGVWCNNQFMVPIMSSKEVYCYDTRNKAWSRRSLKTVNTHSSSRDNRTASAKPASAKRKPSSLSNAPAAHESRNTDAASQPTTQPTTQPQSQPHPPSQTRPQSQRQDHEPPQKNHTNTSNKQSPVVVYVMQGNKSVQSASTSDTSGGSAPAPQHPAHGHMRSHPAESPQEPLKDEPARSHSMSRQSAQVPSTPEWGSNVTQRPTPAPPQTGPLTPLSSAPSAPAPAPPPAPVPAPATNANGRASRSSSLVRQPPQQPSFRPSTYADSPLGTPASQPQPTPAYNSIYNTPVSTYVDPAPHSYSDERRAERPRQMTGSRPGGPGGERAQELVCPRESESPRRSRYHGLGTPGSQPRHLSSCHSPKYESPTWAYDSPVRPNIGTMHGAGHMHSMQPAHSPSPASPGQGHQSMGHLPRATSPSARFRRTSFSPPPPLMASPRWPGNRF